MTPPLSSSTRDPLAPSRALAARGRLAAVHATGLLDAAAAEPLDRLTRLAARLLGVPLRTAAGYVLGSLCAVDERPRAWTRDALATLEDLAQAVVAEIVSMPREDLIGHHVCELFPATRAGGHFARYLEVVETRTAHRSSCRPIRASSRAPCACRRCRSRMGSRCRCAT